MASKVCLVCPVPLSLQLTPLLWLHWPLLFLSAAKPVPSVWNLLSTVVHMPPPLPPFEFWFRHHCLTQTFLSLKLPSLLSSSPLFFSLICFSLSPSSPFDVVSTYSFIISLPAQGCKLRDGRDFSLFHSLSRILSELSKSL